MKSQLVFATIIAVYCINVVNYVNSDYILNGV